MWVAFIIFLVLWIVSVEFNLPSALVIFFFAMVVGCAAVALMPHHREHIQVDHD